MDLNQENVKEQTALMVAAKEGNVDIVKLLVDAGAIVDVSDEDGRSAVHFAAMHNNSEMMQVRNILSLAISLTYLQPRG